MLLFKYKLTLPKYCLLNLKLGFVSSARKSLFIIRSHCELISVEVFGMASILRILRIHSTTFRKNTEQLHFSTRILYNILYAFVFE